MNIVITLRDGKPKGRGSIPNRDEDFLFLQSLQIDNGYLQNGYWWLYWREVMAITDIHLVLK